MTDKERELPIQNCAIASFNHLMHGQLRHDMTIEEKITADDLIRFDLAHWDISQAGYRFNKQAS